MTAPPPQRNRPQEGQRPNQPAWTGDPVTTGLAGNQTTMAVSKAGGENDSTVDDPILAVTAGVPVAGVGLMWRPYRSIPAEKPSTSEPDSSSRTNENGRRAADPTGSRFLA